MRCITRNRRLTSYQGENRRFYLITRFYHAISHIAMFAHTSASPVGDMF